MKGFILVSDGVSDRLISTAHIVAVNGKEIVLEGGITILTDEDFETICEKIRQDTETTSIDAEYLRSGLDDIWESLDDKL